MLVGNYEILQKFTRKHRIELRFGSINTASEVISGKGETGKAPAKALGKFFSVSADLFL